MRAYILKYALAKGIFVTEDAVLGPYEDCITVRGKLYCGRDWTDNEQDAKERVRQMKARKLQSLQKQIEKLNESDCSRIRDYSQLRI